jgi:predicted nucleic acid-binding protein
MAGAASYTAILDANVLYPPPVADLLASLAVAGLYHARWTREIHEEWIRGVLRTKPNLSEKLQRRADQMNRAVPDSLVENYQHLIPSLALPDEADRHVLAAAIVGHADAIVTFNLKDFPAAALRPYNIEAIHPDDFVMNQMEINQIRALEAIKTMRARFRNPPLSAQTLIQVFERNQLPQLAAFLRGAEGLI